MPKSSQRILWTRSTSSQIANPLLQKEVNGDQDWIISLCGAIHDVKEPALTATILRREGHILNFSACFPGPPRGGACQSGNSQNQFDFGRDGFPIATF
jgi:hypothetical protein